MSSTCAKPTCSEPAVAWLVTNPREQIVEILDRDSAQGMRLCAAHLGRFTVPSGWDRVDRRSDGPDLDETGGDRSAWFVTDLRTEPAAPPAIPLVARGDLLNRAFNGPESSVEAGGLARFERIHHEVNGVPEGVGEGQEEERHDHSDGKGDADQRDHGDVGPARDYSTDEHDEQQEEREDRVNAYGADELPFPPFEGELAPRAAVG